VSILSKTTENLRKFEKIHFFGKKVEEREREKEKKELY
jgi:hypothetical protein